MKIIKWIALVLLVFVTIILLFELGDMVKNFQVLVTPAPQSTKGGDEIETLPPEPTDTPQMIEYLPPLAVTPDWTSVPDRAEPLDMTDVQYTFLLAGMDAIPGYREGKYYTDVLMLVILKTDGNFSLINIPRNTLVAWPGREMTGINEVMYEGGDFKYLGDVFQYNFGIRPDAYAAIDISGFKRLIDNLGGIDVLVQSDYQGKCDVNGQK